MQFAVFTASLPELTPEQAVEALVDAGYDGVEWRVTDDPPSPDGVPRFWSGNRCTWPFTTFVDDAARIRELTEKAGLGLPAVGTYVTCDNLPGVQQAMHGTAALGAHQLRVRVPAYDGTVGYPELKANLRRQWEEVTELAAAHGVRALLELHHGTPVASPSSAAALLAGLDPRHVGVIHDVGNMVCEGWETYRLGLEILGEHLAHVHVKNTAWARTGTRADGSAVWEPTFVPLKDGMVDLSALFEALATIGYDGWVSLEDFSRTGDPAERLRDNLSVIRQAAGLS